MKKKVFRERYNEYKTEIDIAIDEIVKEIEEEIKEEPIKVEEPKKRGRKKSVK